jgi:hypothetical protein
MLLHISRAPSSRLSGRAPPFPQLIPSRTSKQTAGNLRKCFKMKMLCTAAFGTTIQKCLD